ncbi:hypothetical protein AGMMS49587_01250 [Spirochaetia bacterium]|nr:hypothetical protein AGMMS49587_01250 [Spirochaetia bacterium]
MGLADKYGYRVLFLLTVLLSGCDIFNTPIRPFIDSQFGASLSDAREITAFIITSPAVAVGTITGTDIAVTVPYGTTVTNIAPIITHTGASISPASGTPQNFTGPVTYTVTAADGSPRDYTVTVTVQQPVVGTDVAFLQSTKTFFTTLQGAVAASNGTAANPDTIILCEDIDIINATKVTIGSGQHVKLIAGGTARINRGASNFGSLITVASGGSLELGGDLALTIDGKKDFPYTATAALITVQGTLIMSSNAVTLRDNNNSGDGGGVYVGGGTFTMSGGSITGNTAEFGGGVFVTGSLAEFTMSGGSITANNNIISGSGKSLYKNGIGTATYGPPWATGNILMYTWTHQDLPYPDSSSPSPAPQS